MSNAATLPKAEAITFNGATPVQEEPEDELIIAPSRPVLISGQGLSLDARRWALVAGRGYPEIPGILSSQPDPFITSALSSANIITVFMPAFQSHDWQNWPSLTMAPSADMVEEVHIELPPKKVRIVQARVVSRGRAIFRSNLLDELAQD